MGTNSPTRIKVCGLRRPEDAAIVNKYLPDYIGFIFDATRRRYIAPEAAEQIRQALDERITPVGVFVNASQDEIAEVLSVCKIRTVQLHGQETNDYIDRLRETIREKLAIEPEIIQAFRIENEQDIETAKQSHADLILLDNGPGGTGKAFDWSLVQQIGRPFMMAGGIEAGNINAAIETAQPYGIDVSSGAETDGVKDEAKVAALIHAVRACV